jgi:tRNA uracil 4-sulfurtransferase
MPDADRLMLLLTLSSEIHLKSDQTRRRFLKILRANLKTGLRREAPGAWLRWEHLRYWIEGEDLDAAAEVAARTFGVQRVSMTRLVPAGNLDELAAAVGEAAGDRVAGHTFAVRVKKRTPQRWRTQDAERQLGSALYDRSTGVNLTQPEVLVRVEVVREQGFLVDRVLEGPDGLPLRTQDRSLALISGGFDSVVAAWMMMRRGSPMHFVHFTLDCAETGHALAVAHTMCERWGHGDKPVVHVVDFQGVKNALLDRIDGRFRQVVLKQLMITAANRVAEELGIDALVTGEALGQVSSQTLKNLAEIDRVSDRLVLRPLAGHNKQEIIDWSRRIGSHDISARTIEVCDLSDGPVSVAARRDQLRAAHERLPDDLVDEALATREWIPVAEFMPGEPLRPVEEPIS